MKLDFVIAGAQKCGTTALWRFLSQHPSIEFGSQKEMHIFDNDRINWSKDIDNAILLNYPEKTPGMIWGDATPIYTYWPGSLQRMHAYNKAMKLIVLLRDPVERAYSHWKMERARGCEPFAFEQAIRGGRARIDALGAEAGVHRVFSYVERGFYAAQLKRVYDIFPSYQVLVLRQCDLKHCHQETLNRVCDFLEVERFTCSSEKVFVNHDDTIGELHELDRDYLRRLYADDLNDLMARYGIRFDQDPYWDQELARLRA
ncbi:sulfotransferase domain-containing protein [Maricaulis sp.]|uniref:sulfotransferase domain-containing protein n=1 Tax=Maricaulis sp. TaxID=1486257 RepID=UPI00260BBCB2|nr:sulfotransferase domain-containing protein [Maricaulis sp.]